MKRSQPSSHLSSPLKSPLSSALPSKSFAHIPKKTIPENKENQLRKLLGIDDEQSIELLKALHILTREGQLNQDSRRKLKQVQHLVQFIHPLIQEQLTRSPSVCLVDHGAGKSYLGFMLYDALNTEDKNNTEIIGIEHRQALVEKSKALAQHLVFKNMRFLAKSVQASLHSTEIPNQVHIVTALHACNTATDDAIDFGLHRKACAMVLVPCCQAELASELRNQKNHMLGKTPLSELWRHPLHTREFGSHLTNILRCLRLEASGYQVTVTELVGWEHAMKNELIIAKYTGHNKKSAYTRMQDILRQLGLECLHERFAPTQ